MMPSLGKIKKGITLGVVFGIVTGAIFINTPTPRAEAVYSVVVTGDVNSPIYAAIAANTGLIAAQNAALVTKEFSLDAIAWALINLIIQEMSQSIITWINSGFEGSPAFIQDLGGFMTGIADRVAGDFIWGSDLQFLCSPFRLDVQFALDIQYRQARNFTHSGCTLSGVVGNIESFTDSNFLNRGWDSWFEMTMTPQNNPHGALLVAQEQMTVRIGNAKLYEGNLLDWANGFLSVRDGSGNVVTPGTAIENQLNETLGIPGRRLEIADELNEILAALFTQLARQAIGGAGGLLGLTQSASAGGTSYYDRLAVEPSGIEDTGITNPIENSLRIERRYRTLMQEMVTSITNAETYEVRTYDTDTCYSGSLGQSLMDERTDAQIAIVDADITITTLTRLLTTYTNAAGTPNGADIQSDTMREYLELQSDGLIHTDADLFVLRTIDVPELNEEIDDFTAEVDRQCSIRSIFDR